MNLKVFKDAVKKSRLAFYLKKRSIYRKYRSAPIGSPYSALLEKLESDGIVVVHDFLDLAEVQAIREEISEAVFSLRDGTYAGPNKHYAGEAQFRLMELDKISPTSKKFFDNEMIGAIAKSYVGEMATCYQKMAELRCEVGRLSIADLYHFDDWRHRFKSFLYLTDVNEENAPFAYLKGTHKQGLWRKEKEFEYFSRGREGTYGHFVPTEINFLKKKHGFEEVVCTGKAGTLILADTRGVHRGTVLRDGERMILGGFYDVL